jgi:nicotinamidase-related amidase
MQKDFLDANGFYAKRFGFADISPLIKAEKNIKKLIKKFFGLAPIIYIMAQYQDEQFGQGKSICVKDTEGQMPVLDERYASKIITKHQHSAFSAKEFENFLKQRKIDTLFIAGVTTEYCVRATALDGLKLGYKVIVFEDCVATNIKEKKCHVQALQEIKDNKGTIIQSADII